MIFFMEEFVTVIKMNFKKEIKKHISLFFSSIVFGLLVFSILKTPINHLQIEKASALTLDGSIVPSGISETLDLGASITNTWRNLFMNGLNVQDGKVKAINNFEGTNPGRGLMVIGGGFSTATGNRFCYTTGATGNKVGLCEEHGLTCDSIMQFDNSGSITADYYQPCNTYLGGSFYFICFCK